MTWWWIALLAAGTYAAKAAGPLIAGDRDLPLWLTQVLNVLPPALLGALVVSMTLAEPGGSARWTRVLGVTAVAVMLVCWRRAPFVVCLVVAAAVTGGLRHLL